LLVIFFFHFHFHFLIQSEENEFVPLLIARCTAIVESKGLTVVGIYRIPGNTAAISALTELVNRGMDDQTLKDPRWDDVNVVSSLLKLFLRSLPDPLLPNDMYQHFIDADKFTGQRRSVSKMNL
jgi:Rho GTPase-activating protein 21/23